MGTQYSHLTLEERCRLRGLMEIGLGVSEIARRLGRHRGTIHREVGRNRCVDGYRPDSAARRAWARKLRGSRIMRSTRLRTHVEGCLAMLSRVRKRSSESFSRRRVPGAEPVPAQAGIAGRMELEEVEHRVSAESIYRHVYSPTGRHAGLPRQLAQRKAKRGRRRRNGRREPSIPNRISIHQRPTKAHLRSQFGHWEGDLVHFRRQRDILLTLQERKTRLTLARRSSGNPSTGRLAFPPHSQQRCGADSRRHRCRVGRVASQGAPDHHP